MMDNCMVVSKQTHWQYAGKEEKNLRANNFKVSNSNEDRTKANLGYSHTTKITLGPLALFGHSHTPKERLRLH